MKTNNKLTKCPGKSRTFSANLRTFTSNGHGFCKKPRLFGPNLHQVASLTRLSKGHVDADLNNAEDDHKGGVEPPQSKVLCTFSPPTPGLTAYITRGME